MRNEGMGNQNIWIAITVILFVAGIGVGYGVFSSSQVMSFPMTDDSMNSLMNNPQVMRKMMQDPNFRNEMIEFMIQDTDHMNQWMQKDPQHVSLMIEKMKVNHDFMMGMAVPMIQDPELRLQLIGHMTENPEAMSQLQQLMGDGMTGGEMMGQILMSSETMKPAPTQTFIVSLAEGSMVPGCELTDECYLPYSLEIWVGDAVSWNNVDSAVHTVTSGVPNNHDGNFDSGMIMINQSWEFTFTDSGGYDYYCELHPWMTGKIIVNKVEEMIVITDLSDESMGHDEHP